MKQADLDRNEIIELARQAGFTVGYGSPALPKHEAFAKLVADVATAKEREWWKDHIKKDIDTAKKEEREACAELVEMNAEKCKKDMMAKLLLLSNADAIRARGEA